MELNSDLKYLVLYIALVISVLSSSILFYIYIENGLIGIERIILLPLFLFSTFVVLAHSLVSYSLAEESYNARYFKIWSISLTCILLLILTSFIWNNYSRNILVAGFYWDSGITLKFKENGTFRAENSDWMTGSVSYGKYTIQGSLIILQDQVRLGNVLFKDTLRLSSDSTHLIFQLDTFWKSIEGGEMSINSNLLFE